MNTLAIIGLFAYLIIGLFIGYSINQLGIATAETPASASTVFSVQERFSPYDHIKQEQIHVSGDKVEIDFKGRNVLWATYKDSNSMDPFIDIGANALEIKPESTNDIHVGDVIAYRYGDGLIVHRVIEIGTDSEGWFAYTKGDNNPQKDPFRVRFEYIERITVAVIY